MFGAWFKCGNFYNIDVGAGYGCGSAEDENFRNAYFQAAMAIKLDTKYCGGPKKVYWIMSSIFSVRAVIQIALSVIGLDDFQ